MDKNALKLAQEFSMLPKHVENVIGLLDGGATVPFIARYRKEMHGTTDDQTLRKLSDRLNALRALDERRSEIASSIQAQEKYTKEIEAALDKAETLSALEDIYRPFKPKRRTRASVAREKGLEPLAEALFRQEGRAADIQALASRFISPEMGVESAEDALSGASDILAEQFSDSASVRAALKPIIGGGVLRSVSVKEESGVYGQYADFRERVKNAQSHRILAMNRGEKEGFLRVSLEADREAMEAVMERTLLKPGRPEREFLKGVISDSLNRLILPSLEREIRAELTDRACEQAIAMFAANLRPLLMQPPLKNRVTLGFDPAYRTGCKLAVVDETGRVLETGVIYPNPPANRREEAKTTLLRMIRTHGVTAIAIGNGTASRESESFVAEVLKEAPGAGYVMVSEAGASVYSASPLAAEEFPEYDVSLRSAVSIARRLQDPLAELVKIDPKAIGVGQYQHDMPANRLDEALSNVVEDCVNAVGVDLNTASASLLAYVSGLTEVTAKNIVRYREENGAFVSRTALKKVPRIGPRAFEQCAGFLRVTGGENMLDATGVHPESYDAAKKLLAVCEYSLRGAAAGGASELEKRIAAMGEDAAAEACGVGVPTLRDIARELAKPGRDIRDDLPAPILRADVRDENDLAPGMELTGTVRNVTDFGAFVDIGVHQDGLVHISELSDRFVRHPSEVVRVGDVVRVTVLSVDSARKRISLTMKRKP